MATAIAPEPDTKVQAPKIGGNFTAVDNGDGTFDLMDVSVFAEVPAGAKRNEKRIGREWMAKALSRNQLRSTEGHLPPVHIYHSDEIAVKPTYAGKLVLTAIKSIVYEGKKLDALFGNIVEIPKDVFELIQARRLPYRSVEVHNWEDPEIDSLALMPTDVPFFRMPMTTVGKVVKRDPEMFCANDNPGPALWCKSEGRALAVCFRFGEPEAKEAVMANVPPEVKPEEKKEEELCNTPKDKMEEGTPPAPAAPDATMAILQQILSVVQALAAQVAGAGAPAPVPPPVGSENLAPVTGMKDKETTKEAPAAVAEVKKDDSEQKGDKMDEKVIEAAILKAMGPAMARLEKIEKRNAELEHEKAVVARMAMAEKELTGISVGDEAKAYLRKCAERDEETLKDAVAAFKKALPAEPPKDLGEFEAMVAQAGQPQLAEAVSKFAAKHPGPKAVEWARAQLRNYSVCKANTPGMASTEEEWLEVNFRADRPDFA